MPEMNSTAAQTEWADVNKKIDKERSRKEPHPQARQEIQESWNWIPSVNWSMILKSNNIIAGKTNIKIGTDLALIIVGDTAREQNLT